MRWINSRAIDERFEKFLERLTPNNPDLLCISYDENIAGIVVAPISFAAHPYNQSYFTFAQLDKFPAFREGPSKETIALWEERLSEFANETGSLLLYASTGVKYLALDRVNFQNGRNEVTQDTFSLKPHGCIAEILELNWFSHIYDIFGNPGPCYVDSVTYGTDPTVNRYMALNVIKLSLPLLDYENETTRQQVIDYTKPIWTLITQDAQYFNTAVVKKDEEDTRTIGITLKGNALFVAPLEQDYKQTRHQKKIIQPTLREYGIPFDMFNNNPWLK
jgi:hypothetical protein